MKKFTLLSIAAALLIVLTLVLWPEESALVETESSRQANRSSTSEEENPVQLKQSGPSPSGAATTAPAPGQGSSVKGLRRQDRDEFKRRLELEGSAAVVLRGSVSNEEREPIVDARVTLFEHPREEKFRAIVREEVNTDRAGRFEISTVSMTNTRLVIEHPGHAAVEDFVNLPDRGVIERRYLLHPGLSRIHGRVVNLDNQPIVGAEVSTGHIRNLASRRTGQFLSLRATTDDAGEFEITGLAAGDIQLQGLPDQRSDHLARQG